MSLDLRNRNIDAERLQELVDQIENADSVNLSGNPLGPESIPILAEIIQNTKTLVEILAFNVRLLRGLYGDYDQVLLRMKPLFDALEENTTLTTCLLFGNYNRLNILLQMKINDIMERNKTLDPRVWTPVFVDTVMALDPLNIPTYTILEIMDRIPGYELIPQYKKVKLIDKIKKSIRDAKNN